MSVIYSYINNLYFVYLWRTFPQGQSSFSLPRVEKSVQQIAAGVPLESAGYHADNSNIYKLSQNVWKFTFTLALVCMANNLALNEKAPLFLEFVHQTESVLA